MTDSRLISGSSNSQIPLLISLAAGWISIFLYLCPGKGVLPAEIVSVTSFFLAQALLPRCRIMAKPLVTPLNLLQFAFSIQLIVMPITVRIWGFAQHDFLPYEPTVLADNVALLLITFAYWMFCAAVHFRNREPKQTPDGSEVSTWPLPSGYIWLCVALGIIGLAAHYKNLTTFEQLFTDPAAYTAAMEKNGASASAVDVAGDFFSSFLGVSLVMFWCRRLDRGTPTDWPAKVAGPALLVLTAFGFALTGYNRANFVFPLIALSAVIGIRAPRQAGRYFAAVGLLLALLVSASVVYRFSAHPEDVGAGPSVTVLSGVNYMEFFQLYAQAPQYLAIVLEDSHYGLQPSFGKLSIASLVSQIPMLGKSLRLSNGRAYYAALTGHPDENPSFVGEVFLDFNILGVVAAFWMVGYATGMLQQRVLAAKHAFEVYMFQTMGIYLVASVLISVDVLGQFFVYYMFPLYVYFACRPFLKISGTRSPDGPNLRRLPLQSRRLHP